MSEESEPRALPRRESMRYLSVLILCGFLLVAPSTVWAEEDRGEEILRQVDAALTIAEDMTATIELTTTSGSGAVEERTLSVWQRGAHQRMVKLTAPARLRGVGLLAKSEDQLYVYLPAFGRVRRVAGRQRGEAFLGSHFTQDDFSRTVFSGRFQGSLREERGEIYVVELRPRSSDEPYERVIMEVSKESFQIQALEFVESGQGEAGRRLTFSEYQVVSGQPVATRIVAEDRQSGGRSEARMSEVQINTGLQESLFTRRQLQR